MPSSGRSRDYHDYVIKDGRFIGAFEPMYQACDDPWQQDAQPSVAEDVALALLAGQRCEQTLDLGCGKGRFTTRLQAAVGGQVTGIDVAPTAVRLAQTRYPQIRFVAQTVPPCPALDESVDLVVASELLWYVLPQLDALVADIRRVLRPGGRLLLIQQFYTPDEQRYGRDVLQTPDDLLLRVPLPPRHTIDVDRWSNHKFIALFEKPCP